MAETLFRATATSYARLSDDTRHRYTLGRRWGDGPHAVFVMLNPSTADADQDDPTIRRCVAFARAWGLDGIHVVNLYAWRATQPADLWLAADPVGPENDYFLACAAAEAAHSGLPIIAAWGANARPERVAHVLTIRGMDRLTALGVTKDGAPKHPLARGCHRIPDGIVPEHWSPR